MEAEMDACIELRMRGASTIFQCCLHLLEAAILHCGEPMKLVSMNLCCHV